MYNAINLTTGPQQLRIHSIERVQNISLWQSYCVKKSATVAREKDPVAAERKYVRNWSRAVWKSTSELGHSSGHGDDVASMAWKLHAIEQTRLRRKYRVDGVGRDRNLISTGCSMGVDPTSSIRSSSRDSTARSAVS